jgi:hypothetical protein
LPDVLVETSVKCALSRGMSLFQAIDFFCVSGLAIWHDNAIVWLPSHSVFCLNRLKNIHAIKAYRDCAGDFDILHARGPAGSSSFHWQKNLDG